MIDHIVAPFLLMGCSCTMICDVPEETKISRQGRSASY